MADNVLLKELLENVVSSPEEYSDLFAIAIREADPTLLLSTLNEMYNDIGKHDALDMIESLVFYEQLASDQVLKDYFIMTKKFVIALEKEPTKKNQYLPHWLKKTAAINLTDLKTINRLSFTNIYIQMQDYLGIRGA
jgi:hypothetical protein